MKNDSNVASQRSWFAYGIEAGNIRAAGSRHHERGKNAEQSRLAAAVWTKESEEFGGAHIERDAVQRGAVLIAMNKVANRNDGMNGLLRSMGGGIDINSG